MAMAKGAAKSPVAYAAKTLSPATWNQAAKDFKMRGMV